MTKQMRDCRFCNLIATRNVSGGALEAFENMYNTILVETANFVVVPALGAIISGYVMILSRKHIYSMAQLGLSELNELFSLRNRLRKAIKAIYHIEPIVFEHGSAFGRAKDSACSVEHAHWHVVPIHLSNETSVIEVAGLQKVNSLYDIKAQKVSPYLLYENENKICYISNKTNLPSQYMRQWVATEAQCPDRWNWKDFGFAENIQDTVTQFQCYFKEECSHE